MTNLFQANSLPGWPYHVSAGGVVFQQTKLQRLYALLYRGQEWHGEESWHLPKGTLENSESLLAAAKREVKEESGIEVRLWGNLGTTTRKESYSGGHYVKTTHYFLFEAVGNQRAHDDEHDRLDWYVASEAYQKLASGGAGRVKAEQELIHRAEEFFKTVKKRPHYDGID